MSIQRVALREADLRHRRPEAILPKFDSGRAKRSASVGECRRRTAPLKLWDVNHFLDRPGLARPSTADATKDAPSVALDACCVCFANTAARTICAHALCPLCVEKLPKPVKCPICRRLLEGSVLVPTISEMLERIRKASFTELDVVVSQQWAKESETRDQLNAAVTTRCCELVTELAYRGLEINSSIMGRLRKAGVLSIDKKIVRGTVGISGRSFGELVEDAFLRALGARFPTLSVSLEGLRPPALLFKRLIDMDLLIGRPSSERPLVKWFTSRSVCALEKLSLDFAFPRRIAVAKEFLNLDVVDRDVVERLMLSKQAAFENRVAA